MLKEAMKKASEATDAAETALEAEIARVSAAATDVTPFAGGKAKIEHPFSDPARAWLQNEIKRLEIKKDDLERTIAAWRAALNDLDAR